MVKKEIATEAEWREMATEARELRDRIGHLIVKSSKFLPGELTGKLNSAQNNLDGWRCKAEDEMFKRGGPQDLNVFYSLRDIRQILNNF